MSSAPLNRRNLVSWYAYVVQCVIEDLDLRESGIFCNADAVGNDRVNPVFYGPKSVTICFEKGHSFEGCVEAVNKVEQSAIKSDVPEFHIGDANNAKPRPRRSKVNFKAADPSSIGAKVEAKPPMSVMICPSALLMASKTS